MFRFQHLFLFLAVGYSLILQKRSHRGSPTIVTSSSGSRLVSVSSGWSSVQSFSLHAASNTVEADQEPKVWTSASFRRPLHWVQRVAHLEDTLQFYENNFNFKVYRHEEFSSGCEATCNGPYGGAWSKTMVGPEPGEGESFCLELVYNYGVNKYDRGNDLRTIAIKESAFKGKTSLIEQDPLGRKFIVTPDGHWLNLIESEAASNSKIHQGDSIRSVSLHVSNLASSVAFYEQVLGATVTLSADKISASCSWDPSNESNRKTPTKNAEVNLFQLPEGQAMDFGASQGRFAIETEDGAQKKIASRMLSAQRSGSARIVHGPVKLEPHGEEVLILTDEDGHEYCFVDARGFQKCVDVAKKQNFVDWDYRKNVHKKATADYIGDKGFGESIVSVEASTYEDTVALSEQDVIFDLYAPWCILCARNKPLYEELANRMSKISGGNIVFAVFDGSKTPASLIDNPQLGMMMSWAKTQGFPALFYLQKGEKLSPIEFNGDWTIAGLTSWISSLSTTPLDLSLMDMTEPPDYVFDDDADSDKEGAPPVSSTQAKLRAALAAADDDDDCGNCSL